MTIPILMLILMLGPYVVARVLSALMHREIDPRKAGAIGLTALFVFTGVGHFIMTGPMAEMLPPWVPKRESLVYLAGVLEFALAAGFLLNPMPYALATWLAPKLRPGRFAYALMDYIVQTSYIRGLKWSASESTEET